MTETLTPTGYTQTKTKLAKLVQRLESLGGRTDIGQQHLEEARRSYQQMIAQYRRDIKLYEAAHPETTAKP
jgi:exonuclease VII small subunit